MRLATPGTGTYAAPRHFPPGDRFATACDLVGGGFIAQQRNVALIGGTGTGKTHLAMAIARSCIRAGARGQFFNTVDPGNRLEAEGRSGRRGRLADNLLRLDANLLSAVQTSSMNLAIRPSHRLAANVCSTWSAAPTNARRRSSPQISLLAKGRTCSAIRR